MSHKPGGRLPLFFARPAVTPATLKTAATDLVALCNLFIIIIIIVSVKLLSGSAVVGAAEDLKLNTTMFGWPQNIEAILELSSARITSRRERAEEELKARLAECEERHAELSKDIDVFRRKEVG